MTAPPDEHKRTMAFAQIALGQIKALRQPASPRHFEIWYNYATGHNPSLNQVINETVSRNGTLANVPAFAAAFSCKAGDRMARSDGERCRIW